MGFLGGIAKWVEDKAEDAWDATTGAVEDAAEDVWDWTKDEAGRVADGAVSLYDGVTDGGKAILSDFGEGSAHFFSGLIKFSSGDFADGAKELGGGLAQATVGAVFDGGAHVLAGAASTVQVIGHLEKVSRPLNPDEIEVLRGIYGTAVDFSQVRIKEGSSGILNAADRAWTSGNTIYMDKERGDKEWMNTLVHEMAHVWQFQNGGSDYQSKSVVAQYVTRDAYQWETAAREEKPWESLNPEDQAELITQMYRSNFFTDGTFTFKAADGTMLDRTAYAQRVFDQLLRGLGAP